MFTAAHTTGQPRWGAGPGRGMRGARQADARGREGLPARPCPSPPAPPAPALGGGFSPLRPRSSCPLLSVPQTPLSFQDPLLSSHAVGQTVGTRRPRQDSGVWGHCVVREAREGSGWANSAPRPAPHRAGTPEVPRRAVPGAAPAQPPREPEHHPSREPADRARAPTHILQGPAHPLPESCGRAPIPPSDSADGVADTKPRERGQPYSTRPLVPRRCLPGVPGCGLLPPTVHPYQGAPRPIPVPGARHAISGPGLPPAARRGSARASRDRRARSGGLISVSCSRQSSVLVRVRCSRVPAAWCPRPPPR